MWASETSLAWASASSGRLLVAFNDEQGASEIDPNDPTKLRGIRPGSRTICAGTICQRIWIGQTLAGLSHSDDRGHTWTRDLPLQPSRPDCANPPCATLIEGDPWLATDGSEVLYSELAAVAPFGQVATGSHAVNAVVVFRSRNGGVTWSEPRAVAHDPAMDTAFGSPVLRGPVVRDKPSISMAGGTSVVAYVKLPTAGTPSTDDQNEIRLATATGGDFDFWGPEETVFSTPTQEFQNPIVRLVDATHGYLAFEKASLSGLSAAEVSIVRIHRGTLPSQQYLWFLDGTARTRRLDLDDQLVPGGPASSPRRWDDSLPMSFDVGGPSGHHLYVAFRTREKNCTADTRSCSAVFVEDCGSHNPVGRRRGRRAALHKLPVDHCQPVESAWKATSANVSAARAGDGVAESHPGTSRLSYADTRIFFRGARSGDGAGSWVEPLSLRSRPVYDPCPSAAVRETTSDGRDFHYFGDYQASFVFPAGAGATPSVVSAYADSRGGCVAQGDLTYDQHVQVLAW